MIIKYKNEKQDNTFNKYMKKEGYHESVQDIQHRWAKIRACTQEFLRLYAEQANIAVPKNNMDDTEEWGICINSSILFPVPEKLHECVVGTVRKHRNHIPDEYYTGTCKSCPYYIPRKSIESRTNLQIIRDSLPKK